MYATPGPTPMTRRSAQSADSGFVRPLDDLADGFVGRLLRRVQPQPEILSSASDVLVVDGRCVAASIGDLAEIPLTLRVAQLEDLNSRAEHHQVLGYGYRGEPAIDVHPVDVVLDDGCEAGGSVFGCDAGREPVAKVEEASCLLLIRVADVHPTLHGPPVELPTPYMDTALEATGEKIGHRRLPRCLGARHQPDCGHPNRLPPANVRRRGK